MKYTSIVQIAALVLSALCLTIVDGTPSSPQKVLVLVDEKGVAESHSAFINSIKKLGYEVQVSVATADDVSLNDVETWLFDKLVVLGGKSKFGKGVVARKQLDFYESGRDVYLALSAEAGSSSRALAGRLGADLEASGSRVVDHFAFNKNIDDGSHTAVLTSVDPQSLVKDTVFSSKTMGEEITFVNGIGFSVSPEAYMTMSVLHASPTAFSGKDGIPGKEKNALGGYNLKLAALVQGRNNARAAVVGSLDMLSNKVLSASKGNAGFALESVAWVFQHKSVLKSSNIRHRIIGGETNPSLYRVKDDVEVAVDIELCSDSVCKPFAASDVQIQFVMLDPYIRKTLTHTGNGTYSAQVKVPDVYGVFKWVLDYKRPGYSWIYESETVPVRPFKHNEYARFLSQAYPYYASVMAMIVGFLFTGSFFLYSR